MLSSSISSFLIINTSESGVNVCDFDATVEFVRILLCTGKNMEVANFYTNDAISVEIYVSILTTWSDFHSPRLNRYVKRFLFSFETRKKEIM